MKNRIFFDDEFDKTLKKVGSKSNDDMRIAFSRIDLKRIRCMCKDQQSRLIMIFLLIKQFFCFFTL